MLLLKSIGEDPSLTLLDLVASDVPWLVTHPSNLPLSSHAFSVSVCGRELPLSLERH